MNELKIFENPEFGQVRLAEIENEPWFVGKDVAEALGYTNPRKAILDHVDDEDKGVTKCDTLGGKQELTIINESGVYSLVFSSKLENAKRFKRWVTSEVLPSIRKNGAYMTEETLEKALTEPEFLIKLANELKKQKEINQKLETKVEEQHKATLMLEQQVNEMKAKTSYYDLILSSKSLVTVTQIAKDYGMGAPTMNAKLHDLGVQYKLGNQWILYSKYQKEGYTSSETVTITRTSGMTDAIMNTKWTQKGRLFIYELLKKNGIVPVIEMNLENRES